MFWDTDGRFNNTPEGLLFKVDLNELIENIFVAPFSKPWYKDIIQELIGKYGLVGAASATPDAHTTFSAGSEQ